MNLKRTVVGYVKSQRRRRKSTVLLTEKSREMIKSSGKTVQKFFDELLDMYLAHDMGSWRKGHLFHRQTRVLFLREDSADVVLKDLVDPFKTGKKMGEAAYLTNKVIWNIDARITAGRKNLFELINNISGWGIISEPSPGNVIVESPVTSVHEFMRGYFEGILAVNIETVESTPERIVFRINAGNMKSAR